MTANPLPVACAITVASVSALQAVAVWAAVATGATATGYTAGCQPVSFPGNIPTRNYQLADAELCSS